MTGEDDSGNPARLPLMEQIERSIAERMHGRADIDGWLKLARHWTLQQAAFLLWGYDPSLFDKKEAPPCVNNLLLAMRQFPLPELIRPVDAARWFQEQFGAYYDLPPGLAALLAESPVGEPALLPQGELDRPEQGAAAKRQIALVEAEDAALALLRKRLKREPDFEEFWNHITERDDTGTVADSGNDRLMWTGKDGRNCETAKSTMRNRLTAAKKRNPFT